MNTVLNFKPDYYKITRLLEPNVLEVEETWFIKLKGVNDGTPPEELKKWLQKGDIVRIIPYWRNKDARIISDVWLGNTHINRQFSNYQRDNFIQAFEYWNSKINYSSSEKIKAEKELIESFYAAKPLVSNKLEYSFNNWIESCYPQKRARLMSSKLGTIIEQREKLQDQMIKEFHNWKKELSA